MHNRKQEREEPLWRHPWQPESNHIDYKNVMWQGTLEKRVRKNNVCIVYVCVCVCARDCLIKNDFDLKQLTNISATVSSSHTVFLTIIETTAGTFSRQHVWARVCVCVHVSDLYAIIINFDFRRQSMKQRWKRLSHSLPLPATSRTSSSSSSSQPSILIHFNNKKNNSLINLRN